MEQNQVPARLDSDEGATAPADDNYASVLVAIAASSAAVSFYIEFSFLRFAGGPRSECLSRKWLRRYPSLA